MAHAIIAFVAADSAAADNLIYDADYGQQVLLAFDVVSIDSVMLHQELRMKDIAADPVIVAGFDLETEHRKVLNFVDEEPLVVQWLQLNSWASMKNLRTVK